MLLLLAAISVASAFTISEPEIMQPSSRKSYDVNAKMKGLFIYSFTRYVKWPEHMETGDFVIAIYGEYESLYQELITMAKSKKAGTQKFSIQKYTDINQIRESHILFIVPDKSHHLPKVIQRLEKQEYNTLLVTDKEGMVSKGAGINFYYADSKQRMEINENNVTKYGLLVSKQLMSVARVVKDPQ